MRKYKEHHEYEHQLRIGHRDDIGMLVVLDQLLQAWPPRPGSMTQEQAMPLRSEAKNEVNLCLR